MAQCPPKYATSTGSVANVKGDIAQVSFSIIWLLISILRFTKTYSGAYTLMPTSLLFVQQPRNCINKDEIFGTVVNCITLWLLRFFSITFKFFSFNHPSCKFFTALLKFPIVIVLAYNL